MVARLNPTNQDAIAAMGGIRPLVELLNGPSGGGTIPIPKEWSQRVQANAALAIACVCRGNSANQTSVADLGVLIAIPLY